MFSNASSKGGLIAILIVVGIAILVFLYMHYKQNTLFGYIVGYSISGIVYASLPNIVGLKIHLHHYLYGLLLLPGTRLQSRIALVAQGLLIGLFVQGVIKYGFASPFDTSLQANAIYTQGTVQTQWNMTNSDISKGLIKWTYPYNATTSITDLYTTSLQKTLGLTPLQIANQVPINEYVLSINDIQVYRGKKSYFSLPVSLAAAEMDPLPSAFSNYATSGLVYYIRVAPVSFGNIMDFGDVAVVDFGKGTFTVSRAFSN
ncbi:hypothetical protein BCR33DRAFT_857276 [Rhizoclosmatium globosum]|uniref:Uncharacterized protein n=1 Tax=Rhizoclosmatium globosum TaxID=329046 RepID=A0A1Y2B7B6_9FUNG|nr:hypothetical protein BCR33DRAFT_857276 [Rhizoclosmatium globosum]|eukprot:ORY30729.1 hypothetical protein BCR33DRAFT_857276 [Rhizoclosmatium globosum]